MIPHHALSAFAACVACLGAATAPAAPRLSALDYPGQPPGLALTASKGDLYLAHTRAIAAAWTVSARGGIERAYVRNGADNSVLALTGVAFRIVLGNGTNYEASAMECAGEPELRTVPPHTKSPCRAERTPGRSVMVPLRTKDGVLEIAWRALCRDQGNYVREEFAITASRTTVTLKEIILLDQAVPGADQCGSVDGSVVVAGSMFFACESPMAANRMVFPGIEIGSWQPTDLCPTQRVTKTWPLSPGTLASGTNLIEFLFSTGAHRLDIWRVAVTANGTEVAADEHHGHTGDSHDGNVYRLLLQSLDPQARYALQAVIGSDSHDPADARIDSRGTVRRMLPNGRVVCGIARNAELKKGETLTESLVMGATPPGQMRRGFLYYLERERAHPFRSFFHYNSWYDIAWHPFALNESNCLDALTAFCEGLKPFGTVIDSIVFDDGWDDPQTLWQFHKGFPRGFSPLAALAATNGARLGVWLSPFGGYGGPREQRIQYGRTQGFETNEAGFSLAGSNYYARFTQECVTMIRSFQVNYFKFDGIANGMPAGGGGAFTRDTDAMRSLMRELRAEDRNVYINLTTGSWPSPFWLRFADSVWRQGGDTGTAGKGSLQQQWLTYRDRETFRNIVCRAPLYPLNSLMTHGVCYSREGLPGDPAFTSAGFKEDVRAYFASGTGLQEMYVQPARLTRDDWAVLAEAAAWARSNVSVLVDTHWIGGDPGNLEVYGWASWTPAKGIVSLRNPDDKEKTFPLDIAAAFELPPGAARVFTLERPWKDEAALPTLTARAGVPLALSLKPFEIATFGCKPESVPQPAQVVPAVKQTDDCSFVHLRPDPPFVPHARGNGQAGRGNNH